MKKLVILIVVLSFWISTSAQNKNLPIIDMHLHAPEVIWSDTMICTPEPCSGAKTQIRDISELLPRTVEEMQNNDVVLGIVTDRNLDEVYRWKEYAPSLFFTGIAIWDPLQPNISFLQNQFQEGRLNIVGEIATQYNGFAPNDPKLDRFYKLAVDQDIPVLIHCAALAGQSALFNITDGNPLLLEPVLKKYPNFRIYVENASYPFAQEIIALMNRYSNVYVDVSTITWLIPRKAFHNYLEKLLIAGYGKRIMFGSDQMLWPESISMGIEAIESASFLSQEEKRDILYNNAARFLRLSDEVINAHHDKVGSR
jgi:predicted TIM-barrel fold metal-dependent hydrolase